MIPEALVSAVTEAVFSHLAEKAESKIRQWPFAGEVVRATPCSQFVPQVVVYLLRQASGGGEELGAAGASWRDDVMRDA